MDDFEADYDGSAITQWHGKNIDIYSGVFAQAEIDKDLVIQMHGWRMRDDDKINFAETSYKRMYWSGYKGQFTTLSWPTGWHTKPAHAYGAFQVPYVFGHEQNYDNSEAVARHVAVELAKWLELHNHGGGYHNSHTRMHVMAHSMGNVVMSEALKFLPAGLITSYTAGQAAESAGAYDSNAADVDHGLLALKLCDTPSGTQRTPEEAWRCYNKSKDLFEPETDFDMPLDMWRSDHIRRNATGQPIDLNDELVVAGGNYVVEHGRTGDFYMTPNDDGNHYYGGDGENIGIGEKTRILNFFNRGDAALTGWEFNQLTKPDYKGGPTWDYTNTYHQQSSVYEQAYMDCLEKNQDEFFPENLCDADTSITSLKPDDTGTYQSIFQLSKNAIPYNDANRINILSHIIVARTEPLGQAEIGLDTTNTSRGEISSNLEMVGYTNSNQDHSAPYHGYYAQPSVRDVRFQQRAAFWNTLLTVSMGLNPLGNDLTGLKNNITN